MAYVDIGAKSPGSYVESTYLNQVRANFQAGVPDIFTTKGDIAVATAADAATRLPVGANDATLVPDTSTASGLAWQIQPACRVYRTTPQAVGASWAAITFDAERYDTDGMHSTVSNTSRVTVPTGGGGIYHIGAALSFADPPSGTEWVEVRLIVNGSTVIAGVGRLYMTSGNQDRHVTITADYALSVTDYVQVEVRQSTTRDVQATGNYSPEFWATWQRRA